MPASRMEEESCLVGSITRPKEAGGSGVEIGMLAVTTGGSRGVPPGNTGISWGISVGKLVGMVPWTRDWELGGKGGVDSVLEKGLEEACDRETGGWTESAAAAWIPLQSAQLSSALQAHFNPQAVKSRRWKGERCYLHAHRN